MIEQFLGQNSWIFIALSVATMPLKAIALWKSARISQKWWFILLFVSNTFGILDVIYITLVAKKYTVESKDLT